MLMIRRDDSNNTYNNMEKLHSFFGETAKQSLRKLNIHVGWSEWNGMNGMNEWMCCECEY